MKFESINSKLRKENNLRDKATKSVKDTLHSKGSYKKSLDKYLGNPYAKN